MPSPRSSRPPAFQPRFTLGLFYLFGFFLLYCLLLVAPLLWSMAEPATPGQQEERTQAVAEATRQAIRPKLPIALLAALATTALGARARVLPGLRRP